MATERQRNNKITLEQSLNMVFPNDKQISTRYFAEIVSLVRGIGGKITCEIARNIDGSFSALVTIGDSVDTGERLILGLSHYRIIAVDHGGKEICLRQPVAPSKEDISRGICFKDAFGRKLGLGVQEKSMEGKEVKQAVVTKKEGF